MLGVILGAGSVIAMLAIGEGSKREALEQIQRLGANNIIIRSIKPGSGGDDGGSETTSQQASMVLGVRAHVQRLRTVEGHNSDDSPTPFRSL